MSEPGTTLGTTREPSGSPRRTLPAGRTLLPTPSTCPMGPVRSRKWAGSPLFPRPYYYWYEEERTNRSSEGVDR